MKGLLLIFALSALFIHSTYAQSNSGQEITALRDMYSKTYLLPSGEKQVLISGSPVHFNNGTSWEDIHTELIHAGSAYFNVSNVLETEFPSLATENAMVRYRLGNDEFTLSLQKEWVRFDHGIHVISALSNWSPAEVLGNELVYSESSGVQDVYRIANGEVKNDLVLPSLPLEGFGETGTYMGFREKLTLPKGWRMEAAVNEQEPGANQGILILDQLDVVRFIIPSPIVTDASGAENNGANANDAAFVIEQNGTSWYVSTLVPTEWLSAPERIFPVTFDPTITIAGNTGGWQSQNNFVDNPGFVFIGVCCGNLEHRAWLKWSVSALPANSCVSMAELQIYVNGVGAATSELVHVYDMMTTTTTGLFGPYGAILSAVYADQATGYYTSFNITGAGYYGWYDLGANAYADVQTMANSYGWYELALIFDNEPSVNWKRLTANMCSLRLTYQDPPCTVLPIELSHQEVQCKEDHALISWTTASELNNDYFKISRSMDGINFTDVAEIEGAGNSHSSIDYFWTDDSRHAGPMYYRISQTDFNGVRETFDPLFYSGCDQEDPIILVNSLDQLIVEGRSIQKVIVLDELGRTVLSHTNNSKSEHIALIPEVRKGFYLVKVLHHQGSVSTEKVYFKQ